MRQRRQWFARAVTVDGIRFASQAEARRYQELMLLQRSGQVHSVRCHPSWRFEINGVLVGRYTADFEVVYPSGEVVIEDVKGARQSRDYILRKNLLLACYGIPVTEVRTGRRWAA